MLFAESENQLIITESYEDGY